MAMMEKPMLFNGGESSQSKEKLQQRVDTVFKAMGINPDVLGIHAAVQEFINQSRLRLDETENKRKIPAQDSLPPMKVFDATNRPESSKHGAERNKRMPSSHSSGFHPMDSLEPATFGATDQPESSRLGAKRNNRKVSSNSGKLESKKVRIINPPAPVVPPVMPAPVVSSVLPPELMNEITRLGGEDVTWVIRKPLMKTDLSRSHDRISIPENQVRLFEDSLTREEMHQVKNGTPIEVDVWVWVTGDGERPPEVKTLKFVWWKMTKGGIYILRTRWWQLVEYYLLEVGDEVLIWCFRQGDEKKLCFAINVRRGRRRNI